MSRAEQSAKRLGDRFTDKAKSIDWSPAKNDREAFKGEARRLKKIGGPDSPKNYNQINSPGKRYIKEDGF